LGAAFIIQLQGFVLATGATAAVQDIVQATALAIGISVYGLRSMGGVAKLRRYFGSRSRGGPVTKLPATRVESS
jgi:hypothetical protein